MDVNEEAFKQAVSEWQMGPGDSSKRLGGEEFMPPKDHMALKSSWRTEPMPFDKTVRIKLEIPICEAELRQLALGHIPCAMEDHWFMYFDGEFIRYYRSWSGLCLYIAKVASNSNGLFIDYLIVNRDEDQYGNTDNVKDAAIFADLVAAELGLSSGKAILVRMLERKEKIFKTGTCVREIATGDVGFICKERGDDESQDAFFRPLHIDERTRPDEERLIEHRWEVGWEPDELEIVPTEIGIEKNCLNKDLEYFLLRFDGQGDEHYILEILKSLDPGKLDVECGQLHGSKTLPVAYVFKWLDPVFEILNIGLEGDYWRYAPDEGRFVWNMVIVSGGVCHRVKGENVFPDKLREVSRLLNEFIKDVGLEC